MFTHSCLFVIQALLPRFHLFSSIKAGQPLSTDHHLLAPYDWVQYHFKDRIVVSIEDIKADNGITCIINDPQVTMHQPYLEPVYLDAAIKSLNEVLQQQPSNRAKNLIATVRGSGGGKTRMLEELRRATNRRDDAVAIGLTFNNNMGYDKIEEAYINDDKRGVNIILSVICRICCVVYHDPVKDILKQSRKELQPKLSRSSFLHWRGILMDASKSLKCHSSTDEMLLTEFIQHVMKQMTINGMVINDFVLLLDEIMYVEDGTSSLASALSFLNQAILNTVFESSDDNLINMALVLSSLVIPPHGLQLSGRKIKALELPPELNVDDVMNKWWKLDEFGLSKDWTLKLLTSTINNLPRALESTGIMIVSELNKRKQIGPMLMVDDDLILSVIDAVLYDLRIKYTALAPGKKRSTILFDPSTPEYLYELIYLGKKIAMDENVMLLLQSSVFTNSIQIIQKNEEILPEGSILMLIAQALESVTNSGSLLQPSSCLVNTYNGILDVLKSKHRDDGDALESAGINWIQTRIAVAKNSGKKTIKLSEIFAIRSLSEKFSFEILLPDTENYWNDEILFPRLSEGSGKFLAAFNAVQYSNQMFKSIDGQQWDTMLMTYRRDGVNGEQKPFLIFIDFKSKAIMESKQSTKTPLKLTQYQYVKELVKKLADEEKELVKELINEVELVNEDKELVKKSKRKPKKKKSGDSDGRRPLTLQSEALINGDYIYIYVTTYPTSKLKSFGKDYTEDLSKGNLYITDEAEAKKFFGILFPFYQTARAAIDSVPETVQQEKPSS